MNIETTYGDYNLLKIRSFKKKLSRQIMKFVKPFMWETGYMKNDFTSKDNSFLKALLFEIDKSFKIGEIDIIGFSEKGVCTECTVSKFWVTNLSEYLS